jgi:hypothetical protein
MIVLVASLVYAAVAFLLAVGVSVVFWHGSTGHSRLDDLVLATMVGVAWGGLVIVAVLLGVIWLVARNVERVVYGGDNT